MLLCIFVGADLSDIGASADYINVTSVLVQLLALVAAAQLPPAGTAAVSILPALTPPALLTDTGDR